MFKKIPTLPLWLKVFIGLVLGTITGLLLKEKAAIFSPIGVIFINAIRMLIVPLIFTAVLCAVLSLNNFGSMAKTGAKTLATYAVTMLFSAALGLSVASWLAPGSTLDAAQIAEATDMMDSVETSLVAATETPPPTLGNLLINIVPSNAFVAFVEANVLQIVFFAVIFALALNVVGAPAAPITTFFKAMLPVVFKLCEWVIRFAPYGVFALIADITGTYGLEVLLQLIELVATIWFVCLLLWLIYGILLLLVKLNPIPFYRGSVNAVTFALSTASSAATLPVTIDSAVKKLGIPNSYAQFLLPLGGSLNLNGLSIYLGVVVVFVANVYGVELTLNQYFAVAFTIVIACFGAAAVPGTALIVMSVALTVAGLPLGIIALIAGVDRLNDMVQTATNVMGDLFTATFVNRIESTLDLKVYNDDQNE